MKLVIIESPYAGTPEEIEANVVYARSCMLDCLMRGEAPYASHLLYTQPGILDDEIPSERRLGIAAGLAWGAHAEQVVFYMDMGCSPGMQAAREHWRSVGMPVVERRIR